MKKFFCLVVIVVSAAGAAAQHAVKGQFKETLRAKLDPALKSYRPSMKAEGEIRSIGADTMEDLTKLWIEGFTKSHPKTKFTMEAKASGTAVPALTDGRADVGPCAREVLPPELGPFEKKFGYKPFAVRVASGSYRTPGKTHAIAFLVNKENPIQYLTFAQIESLYAASPAKPAITTWGQLGLTGEWADKPVVLWGLIRPNGIAQFISQRTMHGGDFKAGINERTTVGSLAALDAVAQGVAADKYAIGYGGFGNLIDGVKAVALSETPDGPYYEGTFDEVVQHKYPLSRYIYIYINREPGKPIDPKVKEYLSYILSKEGQEAVVREGIFLPLTAAIVKEERERLEPDLLQLGALSVGTSVKAAGQAPARPHPKNWTAPSYKIYGQKLCDEIMAKHPELISVTLHGVPPGMDKVYTMFAGSFPDRIGNSDDPDDIDVTVKGITILDPRWHRHDPEPKFTVMMPLRDAAGENVGLIVFAFKNPANSGKAEREYLAASATMRDALQKQIPTYKALFEPAK